MSLRLPASFVIERGFPTGAELGYGLSEDWLGQQSVIEIALAKYKAEVVLVPAEEELALLLSDEVERVDDLLADLRFSDESIERRARYWLYLALFWVAEHRAEYADPLQIVEMLWADFGYPEEIRNLIRFMPEEADEMPGIQGIEHRWRQYLDRVRREYQERDLSRE